MTTHSPPPPLNHAPAIFDELQTSLVCESHPPLCVGLVWTFDFLADVIELRGFIKIIVMKSVGKKFEIIKKQQK